MIAASAEPSVLKYWAKTSREDPEAYHPVVFHGLDVAACGRVLLERHEPWRRRLAELTTLEEKELLDWVSLLLSLHDFGKLATSFQGLRPDLMKRLQGTTAAAPLYTVRHDTMGYLLVCKLLQQGDLRLGAQLGGVDRDDAEDLLAPWLRAVMGHHGKPPEEASRSYFDFNRHFPAPVVSDAAELIGQLGRFFLPGGLPFSAEDYHLLKAFQKGSWLLAGVAVIADWLGSNTDRFELRPESLSLDEYWHQHALPRAREAIEVSDLLPCGVSPAGSMASFWSFHGITALQAYAQSVELAPGPQIFILEEVTGGGKTEAALLLAQRLMADRGAHGLYFALPTMATANAMVRRVEGIFERFYTPGRVPKLILAHSKSRLLGLETGAVEEGEEEDQDPQRAPAARDRTSWLADSRKKALLATVGVGTVDQALIGILPLRHQSLRMAGLVGKVLLVDEVHAYDSYTSRVLQRLLSFHASLGGHAILLSATLPQSHRRELLNAFHGGLGEASRAKLGSAYPLATHSARGHFREQAVAARAAVRRRVAVQVYRSEAEVEEALAAALAAGRCACWIRNTVDDAVEAFQRARQRFGAERAMLFHSRFTVADRSAIETAVLDLFGKDSRTAERRGRLLVATQVVEQSLDVDFDLLITDLAPIDLVLQRAGRLMRHVRDEAGNPLPAGQPGPDGRGPVVLGLLSPEPKVEADAAWAATLFPRGAFVYPDHGALWVTARELESRGGFTVPDDCRALVEAVYGEDAAETMPVSLKQVHDHEYGRERAEGSLGSQNALKFDEGYRYGNQSWENDVRTPTRLGEESTTVRLVRRTAEGYKPWHTEGAEASHWELSQVQVPTRLVAAEDPARKKLHETLRATMRDQGRYCVLVVMEERDRLALGEAIDDKSRKVSLAYGEFGLRVFMQ